MKSSLEKNATECTLLCNYIELHTGSVFYLDEDARGSRIHRDA